MYLKNSEQEVFFDAHVVGQFDPQRWSIGLDFLLFLG